MENSLSCFRLAQCYMTINSVKRQWQQFIRSLDSERRKRQHHKETSGSVTSDERANIFPCLQRAKPSAVANVRWATLCLTLTKQSFRKDDSVERKPTILAHSTAKEKAPEVSPRQCVRDRSLSVETTGSIHDSPTAVPERPLSIPISVTIFHNDNIIHTLWAYFISTKCFKLEIFASVKYHHNIIEINIVF